MGRRFTIYYFNRELVSVTRADVAALLDIDGARAYKLIKKIVDGNVLRTVNRGRYAKYVYNGQL